MPAGKMHVDEIDIASSLVRRLLVAQFPQWAELSLEPVPSAGTDNALYRLGDDMAVRLPRHPGAIDPVEKEQRWLPKLAPFLPLAVPVPLAKGTPGEGYPWPWSICRWLEGENVTIERLAEPRQAATDLAQFIVALQRIDATGGPPPGPHNFDRGEPLAMRDSRTRAAIAALNGILDTDAATAVWEAALRSPAWSRPLVWIHGDLQSGNLLVQQGRLSAVIDFGGLGVGDPACDLQVAWNLFSAETRDVFRVTLRVDEATWARGRGWALSVGLIALPYYQTTNPVLAGISRRAIDEVLAEHKRSM
ncbi:MAG TPA: aminoglycoside phosphotransferase family protein [Aggregatilinea sp.]|uniref:aminoglycoside phosphotransferase family protein n=1 Tax=Aggregatilinea sp. TaxID=2806333 RepID=UPI002CB26A93|nr:aminoglycoside phosphotransferase family protein [Aggregatilinea sp.]HML21004.1 aminoglycoside phosphotransferase family protein [Aggregatilinea sp.]